MNDKSNIQSSEVKIGKFPLENKCEDCGESVDLVNDAYFSRIIQFNDEYEELTRPYRAVYCYICTDKWFDTDSKLPRVLQH